MEVTKHTPAPWVAEGKLRDGDFEIVNNDLDIAVVRIRYGVINNKDDLPLILAAPELYDVLKGFLEVYEGNKGYELLKLYREKAHDVLAKARGEQ